MNSWALVDPEMINAGLAYLRILLELYGREFDFGDKLSMFLTIIKGTRQTKQPEIYSHMVVACLLRQLAQGNQSWARL